MQFAFARYQSTHVETITPIKLVVALYDGALRHLRTAAVAIEMRDVPARAHALGKAHAIVSELLATLDESQSPELCAELARLYEFVLYCISQATMEQSAKPIEGAVKVLESLREAWAKLAENR